LERLRHNIAAVRALAGQRPLICMAVKADAYGHGAVKIAEEGLRCGASFLGVAAVSEGAALRAAGISAPILFFSTAGETELDELVSCNLSPFVSDEEYAAALNSRAEKAGVKLSVHLKIDTGMGRLGCRPEDAPGLARRIASLKSLHYEGTATHFAASDSAGEAAVKSVKKQLALFNEALVDIKKAGFDTGLVHAANSGAVLLYKDAHFDMVRPGILLYGYSPSGELAGLCGGTSGVKPVMEFVSGLSFIKTVKKGTPISYNGTWTAPEDRVIGTIPAGYGDGLPRILTNNYQVLIRGKLFPLVGNICMDQCMVDLGDGSGVERWDAVTIFGGAGLSAADAAAKAGSIPYEITCNVNKRVPRVYV